MKRTHMNLKGTLPLVGVDLGKKTDSTILTVLGVDLNNSVLVKKPVDIKIKDWFEIQEGDYDSPYDTIVDFINNNNVIKIVRDETEL